MSTSRKRGLGALGGALVVVLAIIGVLVAVSTGGSSGSVTPAGRVHAQIGAAASGVTISDADFESMVAPASPDEFANGPMRVLDFQRAVQNAALRDCLDKTGHGDDLPAEAPETPSQVKYFENPAQLRQYGYGVSAAMKSGSPFDSHTPSASLQGCGSAAQDPKLSDITQLTGGLFGAWMTNIEQMEHSGQLDDAWASWVSCMQNQGYDITNEDGVSTIMMSASQGANTTPASVAQVEMPLANIDANCLDQSGVVAQRTETRLAARAAFLDEHRQEFDALKAGLPELIDELSAKYSVTY